MKRMVWVGLALGCGSGVTQWTDPVCETLLDCPAPLEQECTGPQTPGLGG
jgi:hypothetical protein